MKKMSIFLGVIMIVLSCAGCAAATPKQNQVPPLGLSDIEVGMSVEDFLATTEEQDVLQILDYFLYENEWNQWVVAEIGNNYSEIVEIRAFPKKNVSASDFDKIEPGMDIYQVVSLVGIPFRLGTYGLLTYDFKCDNGQIYRINWDSFVKVIDVKQK